MKAFWCLLPLPWRFHGTIPNISYSIPFCLDYFKPEEMLEDACPRVNWGDTKVHLPTQLGRLVLRRGLFLFLAASARNFSQSVDGCITDHNTSSDIHTSRPRLGIILALCSAWDTDVFYFYLFFQLCYLRVDICMFVWKWTCVQLVFCFS